MWPNKTRQALRTKKHTYAGLLIALIMACPAFGNVAHAQTNPDITDKLEQIEAKEKTSHEQLTKLRKKTKAVYTELEGINAELAALADHSRKLEKTAIEIESRLTELKSRQSLLGARFQDQSTALEDLLAALILWQGRRPPILLSDVHETHDSIRAAILMSEAAPALNKKADELAEHLKKFSKVHLDIQAAKTRLLEADAALKSRRKRVAALARNKRDLLDRLVLATRHIHKQNLALAGQANSLRELIEQIVKHAPSSAPIKRPVPEIFAPPPKAKPVQIAAAKPSPTRKKIPQPTRPVIRKVAAHTPTSPTQGDILYKFGQSDNTGEVQRGLTYATRHNAQITAPLNGQVEFAGLFRTYGHIVILNVGNGYLLVLAGMEKVLVRAGQTVFTGEALGYMSSRVAPSPRLYFELRRDGEPIDPSPWLKSKI